MGQYFNLLGAQAKLYDGPVRPMDGTFGVGYFDGTRETGYGGYRYDGRWKPVADRIIAHYGLKPGARVLDVGCGKGFLTKDLRDAGMDAVGFDVSEYAIANAVDDVRPHVSVGSADDLSRYADGSFDLVIAANSLHFMPPRRVAVALQEIMRVTRGAAWIMVDAFEDKVERERLLAWANIIHIVYSVDDWLYLFGEVGYQGDYAWSIVRPSDHPEGGSLAKYEGQRALACVGG